MLVFKEMIKKGTQDCAENTSVKQTLAWTPNSRLVGEEQQRNLSQRARNKARGLDWQGWCIFSQVIGESDLVLYLCAVQTCPMSFAIRMWT